MKSKSTVIGLSLRALGILLLLGALSVACTSNDDGPNDDGKAKTLTLLTYDSFVISEKVFADFEAQENVKVNVLTSPDAGSVLAQLILTKDNPIADVVFGIDSVSIQKALDEDLFLPYAPAGIQNVDAEFQLTEFVAPVNYGDVCLNFWKSEFEGDVAAPTGLDDLLRPEYENKFVTQHPETSSPGRAFLLTTIAKYGEDGWQDYWRGLRQNGLSVTSGWSEAYYGEFVAGGGDRSIVTSYASSPVAEVFYADTALDTPPTGVMTEDCYRQIEYGGIIKGTSQETAARKVMDLFLSNSFQEDIPLNMFVYPVSNTAVLPALFLKHSPRIQNPYTLSVEVIANNLNEWTRQWVEIVLR